MVKLIGNIQSPAFALKQYNVSYSDHSYNFTVRRDSYGWTATAEGYDGPEDKYRTAFSCRSESEAINDLLEQMKELHENWILG